MNKSILFPCLLLLSNIISVSAHAGALFTDVSVESRYYPPYWGLQVNGTWSIAPSPTPDVVIPCSIACYYGLYVKYHMPTQVFNYSQPVGNKIIAITPGMTWGEAAAAFQARFGSSGTVTDDWNSPPKDWTFCGAVGQGNVSITEPLIVESTSSCTVAPLVPVSCTMSSTTEIDHGVLNPSQMAGHTATATGRLSCSRPATMRVRVIPPTVDLGGGWMSTLQIDGVGDGGTITTSGSSDLSFVSRLSGSSTTTGPLTGTSIVILDAE